MDRPRIVLINPLECAEGGSEQRTLELARLLSDRAEVILCPIDPGRARALVGWAHPRIRVAHSGVVDPGQLAEATLVIVGFCLPDWIETADPARLILIVNLNPGIPDFRRTLSRLLRLRCGVELHHASRWIAEAARLPGLLVPSPIDLQRFRPPDQRDRPGGSRRFRVGRLSRDVPGKHHPDDPALYRQLVGCGVRVTVMGGTTLADQLGSPAPSVDCHADAATTPAAIELLPAGSLDAAGFLGGLDCFVYRTHPGWREPSARVIHEAMATGLPVVAHRSGGYADVIEHGVNGVLFDTNAEALAWIERLRLDADLHTRMGRQARMSMERLHGQEMRERLATIYLDAEAQPTPRLVAS